MTSSPAEATVVVVNYNGAEFVGDCLDALRVQRTSWRYDVVVVDNDSADRSVDRLRLRPDIRLIRSERNLGFAGGVNLALAEVRTPYIVLLNNDAVPTPTFLERLLTALDGGGPGLAGVAGKVLLDEAGDEDGEPVINSAGSYIDRAGYGGDLGYLDPDDGTFDLPAEVLAVSGCAVAFRMDALRDVDLLDEDFFLYYEDIDLSWRLRARGYLLEYEPTAVVWHRHRATSGAGELFRFHDQRNRLLMLTKNATLRLWLGQLLRFKLTTMSALLRRRDGAEFKLRMRVLFSYTRLLPRMLRRRRAAKSRAIVPRRTLQRAHRPH